MALSTQRASAESARRPWNYDVFLNFRGADTRDGFVSHLYHRLQQVLGITTFMDYPEIEGGLSIARELPSAIKESHIAIVVLSKKYATSKWCLDELTTIFQCMEARNTILPVFYKVEPSDVGNQRKSYAKAFTKHEKNLISAEDKKKVKQWKADLKKVSKLEGWTSKKFKSESELIGDLVNSVRRIVQRSFTLSDSSKKLVGIDFELQKELNKLLALDANDVRYIGIAGMGGIGKTTLAKLVFDKTFHHFEVHCFLSNVREVSTRDGNLVGLQKQLLFPILKEKTAEVWNEDYGRNYIQKCLGNKKVLLILDDVDKLKQLEMLAGSHDWFGMGSRILITTRNESLIDKHGISYKVKPLNDGAALELFSRNAFGKVQPEEEFLELSERFVGYAKGLPLALEVLGRSLFQKGRDLWKSHLKNLGKMSPELDINSCLKISYHGLSDIEKMVFLDVACYLKGNYNVQVIKILDCIREISCLSVIHDLAKKSLLTIGKSCYGSCNYIGMHDLIQTMGLTIVSQESELPGERSRLWLPNDILDVLRNNTGTKAVEAIVLHLSQIEKVDWSCEESFSKMHRLRLLELDNLIISSGPNYLPSSLRIIYWSWYPSKSLPSSFQPSFLAELVMCDSKLVQLWEGTKKLVNLKRMDLRFSKDLIRTPDFRDIQSLESLNFLGCKNLVDIHTSIADLKELKYLNLSGCKSIESLPSKLEMDSLKMLNLRGCSKVKRIPEFTERMKNLSRLIISGTAIEQIPSSIEHLVGLTSLEVSECKSLGIPSETLYKSSLSHLCSLTQLNLSDCSLGEGDIPDDFGRCLSSLESLGLGGNNFVSLPASIRHLSKLQSLILERCKMLQEVIHLPARTSEGYLFVNVDDCASLKRLLDPSKLSTRFADLHYLHFSCLNCISLVEDEGWINRIFSSIIKFATTPLRPKYERSCLVCPGSEIPEWCSQHSVGNSINVELPQPSESSRSNWIGIVFCVVFADKEYLDNPNALLEFAYFKIFCRPGPIKFFTKGHLVSEHLLVFCLSRNECRFSEKECKFSDTSLQFSCVAGYDDHEIREYITCTNVKKCGARLVYEQDLKELKPPRKIFRRTGKRSEILKTSAASIEDLQANEKSTKILQANAAGTDENL